MADAGGSSERPDDGATIPEDVASVLEGLVGPLTDYLRRRSPRRVLEQESAADLAQSVCREALLGVRRGTLEYRGAGPLRQWVYGAADLKVSSRLRRDAAGTRPSPVPGEADAYAGDGPSPSREVAHKEEEAHLRAALLELDERSREAVRAFHFEGRSHAEVAMLLGVSESHSRTIVARGLARLTRLVRERLLGGESGLHPPD